MVNEIRQLIRSQKRDLIFRNCSSLVLKGVEIIYGTCYFIDSERRRNPLICDRRLPMIFAQDPCSLSFLLRFPGLPRLPEEGLEVYPVLRLLRPVVVEQLLRCEVPGK